MTPALRIQMLTKKTGFLNEIWVTGNTDKMKEETEEK